jgi:hypothetical protein
VGLEHDSGFGLESREYRRGDCDWYGVGAADVPTGPHDVGGFQAAEAPPAVCGRDGRVGHGSNQSDRPHASLERRSVWHRNWDPVRHPHSKSWFHNTASLLRPITRRFPNCSPDIVKMKFSLQNKYNLRSSKCYQKKKIVGLKRGPLSLVSTTEELLDRKVAAPV